MYTFAGKIGSRLVLILKVHGVAAWVSKLTWLYQFCCIKRILAHVKCTNSQVEGATPPGTTSHCDQGKNYCSRVDALDRTYCFVHNVGLGKG